MPCHNPERNSQLSRLAATAWLIAGAALCLCAVVPKASAEAGLKPDKIVVGTMRVPPFVLRSDDGKWSGLSIELWNQIAADLGLRFELREYDYDLAGLLDAVEHYQVDVAIAALPITEENEARFDFSHAYFPAGLGIAVRIEPNTEMLATVTGLFSRQALAAISGLLGLLLVVGALIWLMERRQKAHFDARPLHGIADGVWWAAVTMTSTGYGDKVPITFRGRALGLIWMFASIFLVTLFSATLASSLVVGRLKSSINGPSDLVRSRVGAVAGTPGAEWLRAQGIAARDYPFVIQAVKALQRGEIQALVYEKAILGHMLKEYHWNELRVLPHTLAVRYYAIALPSGSDLKKPINRSLLKIVQGPNWKELVSRYVGDSDDVAQSDRP
jgi:polar amino acid transport system substrate-binding protein